LSLLTACSKPPPPVSVTEFMENPRLLEATMVRCAQHRSEMKYEPDCLKARDAIDRLERAEERAQRKQLEAQSERKRQALRRTQEAAAAARRRAEEDQQRREEAAYLGQFEEVPQQQAGEPPLQSTSVTRTPDPAGDNAIVETAPAPGDDTGQLDSVTTPRTDATDLSSIREELKRRQQSTAN